MSSSQILNPDDLAGFALNLLKRKFQFDEHYVLRHFASQFVQWNGARYEFLEDATVSALVFSELRNCFVISGAGTPEPFYPKQHHVNEVVSAMKHTTHLPALRKSPPFWLAKSDISASEILGCSNGNLRLPSLELTPHHPTLFSFNCLDFAYEPNASSPTAFLGFLKSLWGDQETVETFLEMLGYLLLPDNSQQKMFMLVGPKRSGKSTIGRLIQSLVGSENCCSPTIASFSTNFGLQPLIGKTVAIIPDARIGSRTDQNAVTERLLSVSGEDSLSIDRKYRDPIQLRLNARIVIITNEIPVIADASGALASRFIYFRFEKSFYGNEDLTLGAKLNRERPGILNLAIEGWKRLKARGYFRQPQTAERLVRYMEETSSPISAFVLARCSIGFGITSVDDIYAAWAEWCEERGIPPSNKPTFARELHAVCPGLKTVQRRVGPNERIRCLEGISIVLT